MKMSEFEAKEPIPINEQLFEFLTYMKIFSNNLAHQNVDILLEKETQKKFDEVEKE